MITNNPINKELYSLYDLGALYPNKIGGMEIFNYYFLKEQLRNGKDKIFYISEYAMDEKAGFFVQASRSKPKRIFHPLCFLHTIYTNRKAISYAYLSFAEKSWVIPYLQSIILRFFHIPYYVTIHWGIKPEWIFPYPFRYYFKNAHMIIGVSQPICQYYRAMFPKKRILFIPPLIPFVISSRSKLDIRKEHSIGQADKLFLYVGSLKQMKNPDTILDAFILLGKEILESKKIRLIFAGDGDMKAGLIAKAIEADIINYLSFVGIVPRESIPDYFRKSDYYIISSDYEGTSVSLLEAMFNELPIIASNAPGINGMIQHDQSALLYETRNIQQLSEKIIQLIDDDKLALRLSSKAKEEYTQNYSYDDMIQAYRKSFSEYAS